MEAQNIIRTINEHKDSLRKSERKVADYIIQYSADVITMRIVDLASKADVSEPTVIRFCRAVGFDGFQSFKVQLAQHVGGSTSYSQFAVSDDDTVADLSNKVFDSTMGSLINVRDELDPEVLENAIDALCHANRVEFYGFGASGSVAADAQHKFFRLQVLTSAYTDPHIQHMSAISLTEKDVVVAISQSGKTRALLQSVKLAKETGAIIIGLAPQNTPLAKISSIPIHVNIEERHQVYTPVSSRIAHLLVIDVLAMGVARYRKPFLKEHLKRLNRTLKSLRTNSSGTN